MRRLGFGDWDAPAWAIEEIVPRDAGKRISTDPTIKHVADKFPDAELYVIEGLQGFLPNPARGQSQNKSEQLWALRIRDEVLNKGKTIIAVTHSPKSFEQYRHNRKNIIGSQALIGAAGTIITFALPESGVGKGTTKAVTQSSDRVVTVMGHGFADMVCQYERGESGEFVLSAQQQVGRSPELFQTPNEKKRVMNGYLIKCPAGQEVTLSEIKQWARSAGMGDSSMYGWLSDQIDCERLLKENRGVYRRTSVGGVDVVSLQ
jgi:hypothetical protein